MTLVPLVLDLFDGALNPVIAGTAYLTPSVQLTDPGTGIAVTSGPSVSFRPSSPTPLTWILPTDVSGWAPSGWGWGISFSSSFPGSPSSYYFKITSSGYLWSFTATDASPAVFTASGSSLTDGTVVALAPGGSLPGGFRSNTTYYVVDASGDTFSLAATEGGSALASTSAGSGTAGVVQYLSSLAPVSSVTTMAAYMPLSGGAFTGAVSPAVADVSDAATVTVDADAGNDADLTLTQDTLLATPSNPVDGKKLILRVEQGAGAPWSLSYSDAWLFTTGLPAPALSQSEGDVDLLGWRYDAGLGGWLFLGSVTGFGAS